MTFSGTLESDPVQAGAHEHLLVRSPRGDRVEIDHNTDLAKRVPAHSGDSVTVHGQLYIDSGRVGVHCTHAKTSRGCPVPGWIQYSGSYYQ